MSEHAILPCSSGKEWGNCDGWLALNETLPPQPDTDASIWGTECHDLAEKWLSQCTRANRQPPPCDDKEMLETAELYVMHCMALMDETRCYTPLIEERVATGNRVSNHVWGTCDFALYSKGTLYVRDLKTGKLLCHPDDEQLILYAIALLDHFQVDDQTAIVDLGIVQPRGFHRKGPIRTVRMPAYELRNHANRLAMRAARNLARDGQTQAGPHCYNCNARTRCPAAIATAQALPYLVAEAVPAELQPAEAGLILKQTRRAIKFLEQMEKAYAGEVEGLVLAGTVVPGWGMANTYTRSKEWTVTDEQVLMLGEIYDVEVSKTELKTPTQVQKAGIPEDILNGYCTRRKTGVKLTESDDTEIANIFKEIK